MKTFTLEIQSTNSGTSIFSNIASFNGCDSSGSFGILANAERRITVLTLGLASFRHSNGQLEFLALPGGLLYFHDNHLTITTSHYVHHTDYQEITRALEQEIINKEASSIETRKNIRDLEGEILKRLTHLDLKVNQ